MATVDEFANITKKVIARDGFEGHLPTALYPAGKMCWPWRVFLREQT